MNLKVRYTLQWFVAAWSCVIILTAAIMIPVYQMPPEQIDTLKNILLPYKAYSIPFFLLFIIIVFGAKWAVENLWIPLNQLNEAIRIMHTEHEWEPLPADGIPVLKSLAKLYNEQHENLKKALSDNDKLFSESKQKLESEKNMFAVLINELTEGVVITNLEGSVLLYNLAAKNLFNTDGNGKSQSNFVGLGRHIEAIMDTPLLEYSLNEIKARHESSSADLKQSFIFKEGINLLRVEIVALLDEKQQINGFIFVLQVLSSEIECPHKWTLFKLKQNIRSPLTNIRASIETIQDYPGMPEDTKNVLMNAIREDAVTLTNQLNDAEEMALNINVVWSLQEVSCKEGLQSLVTKAKESLGVTLNVTSQVDQCWVRLDRYWFIQGVLYIIKLLKQTLNITTMDTILTSKDQFISFDIMWDTQELDPGILQEWITDIIPQDTHDTPITLYDILQQHDAEIWLQTQSKESDQHHHIRLFLPDYTKTSKKTSLDETGVDHITSSKPISYDFNIFGASMQNPALDDRPLSELKFTVFDTETTGLRPSEGDEIISIGGVRVINGKLLEDETFDQLVDPQREVPIESVRIHGIKPERLEGKPTIDVALTAFHKFMGTSVLVAHNAAFDMKFIDLKKENLGLQFSTPVLDTLLLSSAINPHQVEHSLEAIAARLNVSIPEDARHTALGDALVTAQIFVKFIPLLKKMGIVTLKEALDLSKATYYAKVKY